MSTVTERQHAQFFIEDLAHHLRETMEAFGAALYAQAEACREELAVALVRTGILFGAPADRLATREESGVRRLPRGVSGTEASQHRVPGSHVEIVSYTLRGYEMVHPEPSPEEHVPDEARHPRDSKVA